MAGAEAGGGRKPNPDANTRGRTLMQRNPPANFLGSSRPSVFSRRHLAHRLVSRAPLGLLVLVTMLNPSLAADPAILQPAARLRLLSPQEHQVFQRQSRSGGRITVEGECEFIGSRPPLESARLEARLLGQPAGGEWPGSWEELPFDARVRRFRAELRAPAGGWFQLEARLVANGATLAETRVLHVGVGEIFLIAGQSNAANHGEEQQRPATGLVSAFDGRTWRIADDPQPGASGSGGSFIPAFGDALARRFGVPIGIASVAAGGTSVREWLPRGSRVTAPPTTGANVVTTAPDRWESTGMLFDRLAERLRQFGPRGARAVLWHQGESDNHQPVGRNITSTQYRRHLQHVIRSSRDVAAWKVPWFVAQASYHTPDDPGSPELRAAQRALVRRGLALAGPNTDELGPEFRDAGGRGVHFNARGLKRHGEAWAEAVGVWLVQTAAR